MNSDAAVLLREARELGRRGCLSEAIDAYRSVLARWPELANAWYNLAILQRRNRQFTDALASYQQAIDRGAAQPEEIHLNRGVIFADDLRRDESAEHELDAALTRNPGYVPALLNLANLHEDRGRRDAALALYQRILDQDPGCHEALARYANATPLCEPGHELIGRLRRAIADPRTRAADRASLGFALGRALDRCGSFAEAFEAYATANRDSRASAGPGAARYDAQAQERFIDRLINVFAGAERSTAAPPIAAPMPIFVCGMFRSGSTLTEQLLAGHPRVEAGGELGLLPHIVATELQPYPDAMLRASPQRLDRLAHSYLGGLADLFPGADLVTDKRPDNFLHVGLIKSLFPKAKIVHTLRNALDNCLSIYFLHLDHGMSYALDLLHIGHYYRQYLRLMAHWKSLYAGDIIEVDYDALVEDPRGIMAHTLESLGLEWDDRCLVPTKDRAIKTASVWQAREPLYRHSSGRSRNYEPRLEELRAYLQRQGV
jgi:tetratricopeptide (TPR) repeat protein